MTEDITEHVVEIHDNQETFWAFLNIQPIQSFNARIQTTTHTADHNNGSVAEVTYEGTPVYPPELKGGYGHAAPVYKAAPAYKPATFPVTEFLNGIYKLIQNYIPTRAETDPSVEDLSPKPKYSVMIAAAITTLKDRTGSSRQAILKYICANYKVDAAKAAVQVRMALKRGVAKGALKMARASGKGAGSFKVVKNVENSFMEKRILLCT